MAAQYQAGQSVIYWGKLMKYNGKPATVVWVNQCGCTHQTYAVDFEDGKRLERVLEESIRPV